MVISIPFTFDGTIAPDAGIVMVLAAALPGTRALE
jgi:hypothetical protein